MTEGVDMDDTVLESNLEELSRRSSAFRGLVPALGSEPLLAADTNAPPATAEPSGVARGPGGIGRSLDAELAEQTAEPQAVSDTLVIEPPLPVLGQFAILPTARPSEPCAEDSPTATFGGYRCRRTARRWATTPQQRECPTC
jgi:hypothetical protein